MRRRLIATPIAQQRPVFRTTRELVSVDVVVRDRDGNIVRGLTPADFEVREDGRPQPLETFTFQEISERPAAVAAGATELLGGVEASRMAAVAGARLARRR